MLNAGPNQSGGYVLTGGARFAQLADNDHVNAIFSVCLYDQMAGRMVTNRKIEVVDLTDKSLPSIGLVTEPNGSGCASWNATLKRNGGQTFKIFRVIPAGDHASDIGFVLKTSETADDKFVESVLTSR